MPACAKACPTESIRFGALEDLQGEAKNRVAQLQAAGYHDAHLYDPTDSSVEGTHAFFLLLGPAEDYKLPPYPEVPTIYLTESYASVVTTALLALALVICVFIFM